ncbi:DUF262 domain-containing protein, partial [uncultured Anaerovibrio sp.]|uniref:DUF262 domain-containing protein n=1 Tax=uncultured Anaerovibrio sp. TaxID=361586 RepID=UPI003437EF7D
MHKPCHLHILPTPPRWKKTQQQKFIDSLIKGYPVGTLLFYEKYENNQWNYILVDGLQRGNCIRHYNCQQKQKRAFSCHFWHI